MEGFVAACARAIGVAPTNAARKAPEPRVIAILAFSVLNVTPPDVTLAGDVGMPGVQNRERASGVLSSIARIVMAA